MIILNLLPGDLVKFTFISGRPPLMGRLSSIPSKDLPFYTVAEITGNNYRFTGRTVRVQSFETAEIIERGETAKVHLKDQPENPSPSNIVYGAGPEEVKP